LLDLLLVVLGVAAFLAIAGYAVLCGQI